LEEDSFDEQLEGSRNSATSAFVGDVARLYVMLHPNEKYAEKQ